jgi:hypothetical protein
MAIGSSISISSCEELQMIGYHPAYPANGNYKVAPISPATTIDCSATDITTIDCTVPTTPGCLWEVGYFARFGPNGKDGKVGGGDDATDQIATDLGANLQDKGFKPILLTGGVFDGNGQTITGLYIYRINEQYVGLFGKIGARSTIKNVGVISSSVTGGLTKTGSIIWAHVGGLVGYMSTGPSNITNCYFTGTVNGYANGGIFTNAGGLVGTISAMTPPSSVNNSYFSGSVTTTSIGAGNQFWVGGLVGTLMGPMMATTETAIVSNSYAQGSVTNANTPPLNRVDLIGGLVGAACYGDTGRYCRIYNSYSTATVSGHSTSAGGLVGSLSMGSKIINSYATGGVSGDENVGGLVGYNRNYGSGAQSITNSYATGVASGIAGAVVGGLIGRDEVPLGVTNSWWFNSTNSYGSGSTLSVGNKAASDTNFLGSGSGTGGAVYSAGWDFSNVWNGSDPNALPHLRWQDS